MIGGRNASSALSAALAAYRRSRAPRFRQRRDGLRLSILASCLLAYSVLAFTEALAPGGVPGVVGGTPTIFGGVTIAIIIIKIARPEVYADWILSAAIYVGVGLSLFVGQARNEVLAQISFSVLLIAAGAVRIWIGLTVDRESAAVWLCSSGGIAMASGLVAFADWLFAMQFSLPAMLAVDLASLGISIARFGILVRDGNDAATARRYPK